MLEPAVYRCPWCLRETLHPDDVAHDFCSCCGSSTDRALTKACEHRSGSTLAQLWADGIRLVRREPWADGNYLELVEGRFGHVAPFGLVHSPLEWQDVPADVAMTAQRVPLWGIPRGGWERYSGPTVEERRWLVQDNRDGTVTITGDVVARRAMFAPRQGPADRQP